MMKNGEKMAHPANQGWHTEGGLTKREHFAAMAMQGLIANAPTGNLHNTIEGVSLAVAWADALLKALEDEN